MDQFDRLHPDWVDVLEDRFMPRSIPRHPNKSVRISPELDRCVPQSVLVPLVRDVIAVAEFGLRASPVMLSRVIVMFMQYLTIRCLTRTNPRTVDELRATSFVPLLHINTDPERVQYVKRVAGRFGVSEQELELAIHTFRTIMFHADEKFATRKHTFVDLVNFQINRMTTTPALRHFIMAITLRLMVVPGMHRWSEDVLVWAIVSFATDVDPAQLAPINLYQFPADRLDEINACKAAIQEMYSDPKFTEWEV